MKNCLQNHTMELNSHRSMETNEMHFWVLGEPADLAKPLSIAFEKSWQIGEVTGDWEKRNITYSDGGKERTGELQTSEPQLCAWEDLGIDPSQRYAEAHKKQTAHQTVVCAHSPEIKLPKCMKRGVASG